MEGFFSLLLPQRTEPFLSTHRKHIFPPGAPPGWSSNECEECFITMAAWRRMRLKWLPWFGPSRFIDWPYVAANFLEELAMRACMPAKVSSLFQAPHSLQFMLAFEVKSMAQMIHFCGSGGLWGPVCRPNTSTFRWTWAGLMKFGTMC